MRAGHKVKKIYLFVFFIMFCICLPVAGAQVSPFDDIKKTYSAIISMEARFKQRLFISSLKKEREFEGDFYYKRQRGFLWRYNKPKVKFFLYDSRFIWQGDEDKPVVYKRRINKEKTGGTFLDLIEDISKMDELFKLKGKKGLGDIEIMELVPKKEGNVTSARVWIDRLNMVKQIEINEFTGNTNIIEFSYIKVNQPIDDSRFVYKPDRSKQIVDAPN